MTDTKTDPLETWVRREEAEWERRNRSAGSRGLEPREWTLLGGITLTLFASLLLWAILWLVVGGLGTLVLPGLASLIPPS